MGFILYPKVIGIANEESSPYFLAALITSTDAKTMPVMVASQISSQSIKWWNMAAISAASCLPLIIAAIFLERYIVKGMAAGAVKC